MGGKKCPAANKGRLRSPNVAIARGNGQNFPENAVVKGKWRKSCGLSKMLPFQNRRSKIVTNTILKLFLTKKKFS